MLKKETVARRSPRLSELLWRLAPDLRTKGHLVVLSLLLTMIGGGVAQATPLLVRQLVDRVAELPVQPALGAASAQLLLWFGGLLLLVTVISALIDFGQRQAGERLKVFLEQRLTERAARHALTLDLGFYTGANAPNRVAPRIERGAESIAKIVKTVGIDLLPMLSRAAIGLVVLYIASPVVGVIATVSVPLYILASRQQAALQRGVRMTMRTLREERLGSLLDVLGAITVVQSFVREHYEGDRHSARSQALATCEARHHLVNHLFDGVKLGLDDLGALAIIVVSALLVVQGGATVGTIMLHLLLYKNVTAPIRELHRVYDEYHEAQALWGDYFVVLDRQPAIVSPAEPVLPASKAAARSVELSNVSFSYTEGRKALESVSLSVKQGTRVALVGRSGSGKTTIANLISRFFDPQIGAVLMDGRDLRAYDLAWVREQVGMVLQHGHIFPGSISDNIRYGDLGAMDGAVLDAARRAGLADVLARLPDGLDAPADALSGGERQRIALARVFLRDPAILVLDEPTASLDSLATERIRQALDDLCDGRTVVIISHNPALFMDADEIYVLDQGRIVEHGEHGTLMQLGGQYARIVRASMESQKLTLLARHLQHVSLDESPERVLAGAP